ncbi:MAG TPA: hypothetical protein VMV69_27850 [Pirellulales bacterium]|nr:hypothetical protein [Pirellulales bacterium]
MKTLREIGTSCATDKVSGHGYDVAYERHFGHLRGSPLRILEIGVGGGVSLEEEKKRKRGHSASGAFSGRAPAAVRVEACLLFGQSIIKLFLSVRGPSLRPRRLFEGSGVLERWRFDRLSVEQLANRKDLQARIVLLVPG